MDSDRRIPALSIDGANLIVDWWGEWIEFHDFHILTVPPLDAVSGEMRIHAWRINWEQLDEQGHVTNHGHCLITFLFREIQSFAYGSEVVPAPPAIIGSLAVTPHEGGGWLIEWETSYGMDGWIHAEDVSIQLEPGRPEGTPW